MSVALGMQHANCMSHITVSGCTIFFHILINYRNFGEKLLNIKCLFFCTVVPETFLVLSRIQGDINVHRSSHKVPSIHVRF